MELPKNVTQIGEVGKDCKVYVEDYVVSYMKQMNQLALDKGTALALYGRHQEENDISYFFLYGACKLSSLQREVRHLSQAQRQEIESLRRKYFPEYTFLGYRLLNGEMVEGFHICEQEICRYISGYAQFYEKNDSMLAYMLAVRDEVKPEQFNQEKYEEVKRRQEERRTASRSDRSRMAVRRAHGNPKGNPRKVSVNVRLQRMRLTAAGVFALLCVAGVLSLQEYAPSVEQWLKKESDRPAAGEADEIVAVNAAVQKDTLVLEDKLEQALLEENRQAEQPEEKEEPKQEDGLKSEEEPKAEEKPETTEKSEPAEEAKVEDKTEPAEEPAQTEKPEAEEVSSSETVKAPSAVAYVVRTGDTLSEISVRQYGSDIRVADICSLNKISNPDDIKVGQVIMLPK